MLPNTNDDKSENQEKNVQQNAEMLLKNLDLEDLPNSIFACDVPIEVFNDDSVKAEFESLFQPFEAINFIYLRNFRRVRIYFETSLKAAQARIALHEYNFKDQIFKVYFAQVQTENGEESSDSLLPPMPEKCFLISPPASPPVGWEPIPESEPVINYHLLTAIATLQPGESHEIHPGSQSTPRVVLHTCEEDLSPPAPGRPRLKIQQTKRPDLPQ